MFLLCTGELGHKVFRKATHTDRYLHKQSNHHPGQKRAVMRTLVDRALRVCEPRFLRDEMDHLEVALRSNGYSAGEVRRVTRPSGNRRPVTLEQEVNGRAFLPFIKGVTDRIARLLRKHPVRTFFRPTKSIQQHLGSAKDVRDPLASGGVFTIPCSCGRFYTGTTKRSAATRIKEHRHFCRLLQPEKSAVAEHILAKSSHEMLFEETRILSSSLHYTTRLHREAMEIFKHGFSINRMEETLRLNQAWYPALREIRIAV